MAVDDLDLVPVRRCFLFGTSIRNQRIGRNTSETSSEDVIIPGMPSLAGESQGGTTIALSLWTPERL
jgi:hypothetical protein